MKKILVIDDEPAIHRLLQIILDGEGFLVIGPEEGAGTARAVSGSKPDLIILDIMMPEVDGFDVLQILKDDEETREIPVIILTASNRSMDMEKARRLGAVDYLTKPFQPAELLQAVRSASTTQSTSSGCL
jgi:CheY-like chemotaxis protein